jgi:hypothetical protein
VKTTASIAVANEGSNNVSILLGAGNGTFSADGTYSVGKQPVAMVTNDFDGNGSPDIATANAGNNTVTTLLNCYGGKNCNGGIFLQAEATQMADTPVALATGGFGVVGRNDPGSLLKGGFGYQAAYNWSVGNTLSTACSGPNYPYFGVWTCGFTGPNGYQAQAVWDSSQSCKNNVCTYSSYTAPSQYVQYETAYGQVVPIQNHKVQIGYIPIFLENQNAPRTQKKSAR